MPAPVRLSIVVPFHGHPPFLSRCLAAIDPPAGGEILVVGDGADCSAICAVHNARALATARRAGPAVARNLGASVATGDVLVFIDADVVVNLDALAQVVEAFVERPSLAAIFGSYDDSPADPGFASQYKNLAHAFVHRSSSRDARTFWAGFGAVRRDVFLSIGGFDERFDRPSVEDIDLGYRLHAAGHAVRLDSSLRATHLKRWTLASMIVSDVRDRGIPWTQLMLRYGARAGDLNLQARYRASVVLVYVLVGALLLAATDGRWLWCVPPLLAALTALNRRCYTFFYRRRGLWFATKAWALHLIHHGYNGVSFAAGVCLYLGARHLGVRSPGALPVDAWTAASVDPRGAGGSHLALPEKRA